MILDESELCFGDLHYENRLVAFFDILGWRNEIEEAGDDPKHIARLATAVRMFAASVGTVNDEGALLTTFSDNVVFSKPFKPSDVPWLLQGLATTQLGLAVTGFWMRGGVAIGNLIHDDHIVFGPGLNRAYFLESKVAKYPRIVVDDALGPHLPEGTDFLEIGTLNFIDAYRPEFWDRIQENVPIQEAVLSKFEELAGLPIPKAPVVLPGSLALAAVATRLSAILTSTNQPDVWEKLSWLFDRIAPRIGSKVSASDLPQSASLKAALNSEPTS